MTNERHVCAKNNHYTYQIWVAEVVFGHWVVAVFILVESFRVVNPFREDYQVVPRDKDEHFVKDIDHVVAFTFERFVLYGVTYRENWKMCVDQNWNADWSSQWRGYKSNY